MSWSPTNEAKKTGVYLLTLNTVLLKQWCPGPVNQIIQNVLFKTYLRW